MLMVIDKKYINQFILATEWAAYGAHLFKGKGDKISADQSAVNEMRKQLNKINMRGKIVIGEGELDEAPMLYINEKVGNNSGDERQAGEEYQTIGDHGHRCGHRSTKCFFPPVLGRKKAQQ